MEMLYYFLKNISILGITIITGGTLATLFVAKFCWKSIDNELKQGFGIHSLESESESESEPENIDDKFYNDDKEFLKNYYIEFELKYESKFNDLKVKKLTDTQKLALKDKILTLDTPLGTIKIYYDFENLTFNYYSKKSLEFWFLQILSKAYALEFDCKDIILDNENQLIEFEKKKDKENSKFMSVFLKKKNSKKLYENNSHLIPTNKFIYKGKISQFEEDFNKIEKDDFLNISYKDYLNFKKSE